MCQLGALNGCNTESYDLKQNCLISHFPDTPRWTKPGAIPELSSYGEPWCARYGKANQSKLWTCQRRRKLMTKIRYNFYANEVCMCTAHVQCMCRLHMCA